MRRTLANSGWRAVALGWVMVLACHPATVRAQSVPLASRPPQILDMAILEMAGDVRASSVFALEQRRAAPVSLMGLSEWTWQPASIASAWALGDKIVPSTIGGGLGQAVKLVGLELTGKRRLGGHTLAATIGGVDLDRSAAGAQDRQTYLFRRQPLPVAGDVIDYVQPRYSPPLLDVAPGVFKRPGYYGKLAWTAPIPFHAELLHYDSKGEAQGASIDREWGRRTTFDSLGVVADLGQGWEVRAQGLLGRTRMGDRIGGRTGCRDLVDTRFRAGYGMVTHRLESTALSARVDLYSTRGRGNTVDIADDQTGWAVTLSAKRQVAPQLTALVEVIRAESDRAARLRAWQANQTQNQVLMGMRAHW